MYTPQLWGTANSVHHPGTDTEGLVIWDQKGVVVVWPDGHRSRLSWAALRAACQCVECRARPTDVANADGLPSPEFNG
jgi:hypothetical protein